MRPTRNTRMIPALMVVCLLTLPAPAQYSGGTGEPNDPYQIATAEDLIALGETPDDYDRHFILTADIDLDPNLPGGKVFDKAVIAPYSLTEPFAGVFEGNGFSISNLTITGTAFLGLFGVLESEAAVKDLWVLDANIVGRVDTGAIAGSNGGGLLVQCHSTGIVTATTDSVHTMVGNSVGGLVGLNSGYLFECHSSALVKGGRYVGGLVGDNSGYVAFCYSDGDVNGVDMVGGLVGRNRRGVLWSYSLAPVNGEHYQVGGFVGLNLAEGTIIECYSTGSVIRQGGGFAGRNGSSGYRPTDVNGGNYWPTFKEGDIQACFWDVNTSGLTRSEGATGLTTTEMQTASTFLEAGWDFIDETENGTDDLWWILEGQDYPRLWWELIPEN